MNTDDADPASSIMLPKDPDKKPIDEILSDLEIYFKNCSYDCGKNYSDGFSVELLRDNLDASTLLSSITRIVFDSIRQSDTISDSKKLELSLIYQAIERLIQVLRVEENNNVAHIDVLCKLIGYCMKNYQTYK